jgi:DNA-binding MarR family transcriptional regulator
MGGDSARERDLGNEGATPIAPSERAANERAASDRVASDRAPLKLEHFLPYQLQVATTLMSQALSRVYARRYRLGIPEWRVLVVLGQFGWMNGKTICAHTHMHKTKVSRAVAILERRKLVARRNNRADMRESLVALTGAGRDIYEELAPHAVEFTRKLTEILSPNDQEAFHRALRQLTDRSAQLVAETIGEDRRTEGP